MCNLGRCYGSYGSYSCARWPRAEQGGDLLGGGHGGRGGAPGAGSGGARRKGGRLNRGGPTNSDDGVMSRP
jgi:hypothetical protein